MTHSFMLTGVVHTDYILGKSADQGLLQVHVVSGFKLSKW